jgi:thioredoxin 2
VRVPAARVKDDPRCPACHESLFTGAPIALDDGTFDRFVLHNDLPVLIDFWAPWCGPCRTFGPVIEEAARRWASRIIVAKVNSDEAPAVAQRHQIRSIPTITLYKEGRELARKLGAVPLGELERWISSHGV